jgi:hypothetical protein
MSRLKSSSPTMKMDLVIATISACSARHASEAQSRLRDIEPHQFRFARAGPNEPLPPFTSRLVDNSPIECDRTGLT